jgi:hypothetical protein
LSTLASIPAPWDAPAIERRMIKKAVVMRANPFRFNRDLDSIDLLFLFKVNCSATSQKFSISLHPDVILVALTVGGENKVTNIVFGSGVFIKKSLDFVKKRLLPLSLIF